MKIKKNLRRNHLTSTKMTNNLAAFESSVTIDESDRLNG